MDSRTDKEKRERNEAILEYGKKFGVMWILWWADAREYRERVASNRPFTKEEIARVEIEKRKEHGMPEKSYEEILRGIEETNEEEV